MASTLDLILLGPAPPYRGGIAETQLQFAQALHKQNKQLELWTFTQLYPSAFFPGKTQLSLEKIESSIHIHQKIHAYQPWQWKKVAKQLNALSPKIVVFRYWTPFLSPCWTSIAKHLDPKIKRIALVDNWKAHEPKPWDSWFNRRFSQQMNAFSCLSEVVKMDIEAHTTKTIWSKMHPIAQDLPPKIDQQQAREILGLNPKDEYLLFFGLIRPYKGLDLLLNAFVAHPQKKLLIVGECYENAKKYNGLIQQLNLKERVDFQNRYVNHQEAALYFSAVDAVILPYKSATQSGVLSMAYHYTTPLVVTNHPGLTQPILKDNTGIICAPTVLAITKAITALFSSTQRENFKKNLKKKKNQYSWESYAREWINFAWNE